ncbi:MAG: Hpt domain-containing protein, partial [Planctomycetaceae bacterium]
TEIEDALQEQDSSTIVRAAHSVKGLASNFDAIDAIRLAAQVQDAAEQPDFSRVRNLMGPLRKQVELVADALRERFPDHS